jgi:hypothetical protein
MYRVYSHVGCRLKTTDSSRPELDRPPAQVQRGAVAFVDIVGRGHLDLVEEVSPVGREDIAAEPLQELLPGTRQVIALELVVVDPGLAFERLRAEGVLGVRVGDRQDQVALTRDRPRGLQHAVAGVVGQPGVDHEHRLAPLHEANVRHKKDPGVRGRPARQHNEILPWAAI